MNALDPPCKSGNESTAYRIDGFLIDLSKTDGITLACTSRLDELCATAGSRPQGGRGAQRDG